MALTSVRLGLRYPKGSFTFSKIDTAATDDQLIQLAEAIASIQERKPVRIIRTDVSHLAV